MKSLKEMKAALTASEMLLVKGGYDVVSEIWIDDDPENKVKTVSSDCKQGPASAVQNCRTVGGAIGWVVSAIANNLVFY